MVGGKFEGRRPVGKLPAPVVQGRRALFAGRACRQAARVVADLQGRRRERRPAIGRRQFLEQDAPRLPVAHEVMDRDEEHMVVLGHAEQPGSDERPVLQIEGRLRLRMRQLVGSGRGVRRQLQREARGDALLLAVRREGRAQRVVPVHQGLERRVQSRAPQRPAETQPARLVVGARGGRAPLRGQPDLPLRVGRRGGRDGGRGLGRGGGLDGRDGVFGHEVRHRPHGAEFAQQVAEQDGDAETPFDRGRRLREQQRIKTERGERGALVPRHVDARHLGKQRGQPARDGVVPGLRRHLDGDDAFLVRRRRGDGRRGLDFRRRRSRRRLDAVALPLEGIGRQQDAPPAFAGVKTPPVHPPARQPELAERVQRGVKVIRGRFCAQRRHHAGRAEGGMLTRQAGERGIRPDFEEDATGLLAQRAHAVGETHGPPDLRGPVAGAGRLFGG